MKLYEIAAGIRATLDRADLETGELSPDAFADLDVLALNLDAKIDGLCGLLRELQADADAARVESKRLAELARVRENHADRLKAYLLDCLRAAGLARHETPTFKIWQQANPPSYVCVVTDPRELPPELQRVTVAPDLAAAREQHKTTGVVPTGFEVKSGSHLRIK